MRSVLTIGDVRIERDTEPAAIAAMTYFVTLQKFVEIEGRVRVVAMHLDEAGELNATRQSLGPEAISLRFTGEWPLGIKPSEDLAKILEEGHRETGNFLVYDTAIEIDPAELLKEL